MVSRDRHNVKPVSYTHLDVYKRQHHADADEELLGAPIDDKKAPANGAINEDMASLDELLNQLVDTDDAEEAKDNDEE